MDVDINQNGKVGSKSSFKREVDKFLAWYDELQLQ